LEFAQTGPARDDDDQNEGAMIISTDMALPGKELGWHAYGTD